MTLREVINKVETAAGKCPSVNSIVRNDVFRLNTLLDARYGVFAWTQGQHREDPDGDLVTYQLTLFYVDRLKADRSNELAIQSVGVSTLSNVARLVAEELPVSELQFTTFNQRFSDECAGVFAGLTIRAPRPLCPEGIMGDYNMDYNGDFLVDGKMIKIY